MVEAITTIITILTGLAGSLVVIIQLLNKIKNELKVKIKEQANEIHELTIKVSRLQLEVKSYQARFNDNYGGNNG